MDMVVYQFLAIGVFLVFAGVLAIFKCQQLDDMAIHADTATSEIEAWLRFRYRFDDSDIRWYNSRTSQSYPGFYPDCPPPPMPLTGMRSNLIPSVPSKYVKFIR